MDLVCNILACLTASWETVFCFACFRDQTEIKASFGYQIGDHQKQWQALWHVRITGGLQTPGCLRARDYGERNTMRHLRTGVRLTEIKIFKNSHICGIIRGKTHTHGPREN